MKTPERADLLIHDAVVSGNGQYAHILNTIPAPVAYLDKDLRHQQTNGTYQKWSGWNADDIMGKTLPEVWGSEIFTQANIDSTPGKKGLHFESTAYRDDKLHYLDILLIADLDHHRHIQGYTLLINDVTEKKLAQEKVEEIESHYVQLLNGLPVAVYTCDECGYVKLFNKAAASLWGREPIPGTDKWCGSWKIFKTDGTPLQLDDCPMAVTLKEGRPVFGQEIVIERPDGSKLNVMPHPQPILNDSGKVTGAINMLVDVTQQRLSEQALRDSEERLRYATNSASLGTWDWYPLTGQLIWDARCKAFFGLPPEAAVDYNVFLSGVHPDDRERVDKIVRQTLSPESGGDYDIEYRTIGLHDKRLRWIRATGKAYYNENGETHRFAGTVLDISGQKESEALIKESEERFRTLADQAPIIIWMSDGTGNCIYVNSKWSQLTGKPIHQGYGHGWTDFIHGDDRENVLNKWKKTWEEKKEFDLKFRYKKQNENYCIIRFTGTPRYSTADGFVGYIGILEDVTLQEDAKHSLEKEVRKHSEDLLKRNEELRRSEEQYHKMVSEVQEYAIISLSKDGIIENWNKGAEKIKGYRAEEAVGKNFSIFYTEEDRKNGLPAKLIERASKNGKATHEGWRVRKNGITFWGSIVITALHDDEDNVVGFSKVTRDLTVKKAMEDTLKLHSRQLEEKNKELEKMNQELASFAYVSSHDLQEPLRKIQTFSSRILELEAKHFTSKGKDYFNRIQNAASRMQALIEDLLTYSRTNTAERKFEFVNLNDLLEDVKMELRDMTEEKKAVIESQQLPRLYVVSFQLRQLFINILTNALKFSKNDTIPKVVIKSDIIKGNKIAEIVPDKEKEYHHISFADNGIGFEPEYCNRIFHVFQRLHSKNEYTGTGIGLSICKRIVENHAGFITAEGEPGKGATFHVYFPV